MDRPEVAGPVAPVREAADRPEVAGPVAPVQGAVDRPEVAGPVAPVQGAVDRPEARVKGVVKKQRMPKAAVPLEVVPKVVVVHNF